MRRIASHFLILSSKEVLKKQVIEIADHKVIRHFPLENEIESAQWMPGVLFVTSQKIDCERIKTELIGAEGEGILDFLNKFDLFGIKENSAIYLYLFNAVNLNDLKITKETNITEL